MHLPQGWASSAIEDIASVNPRHPRDLEASTEVSFVPMAGISEHSPRFEYTEVKPYSSVRNNYTHFQEGDVLFAKITPCMENGKAAIARDLRNGLGCGTTELHVLRPLGGIPPEFLYHYLHQQSFRNEAARNMTGTSGHLRVPVDYVREAQILVPPLNEQHRIVAKLEKLLAKVDKCQERLDKIPAILKRFRQSVLAAACSGRLTADWRDKNADEISRPDRPDLPKAVILDDSQADVLPSTWFYTKLEGSILDLQNGVSKRKSKVGEQTVVLRLADIYGREILPDNLRKIKLTREEVEKYGLSERDILVTRVNGSPEIVGSFTLYDRHDTWAYCDHFIRLRTDRELLDENYLVITARTADARRHINLNMVSSAGQNTVSQKTIKSLPIPLPPISEQQEIVLRVEALFQIADRIQARYEKAKVHIDKLTQSILAKAFRGELVPQDPNDDPASKLLERIRAEREAIQAKTHARRRPRTGQKRTRGKKGEESKEAEFDPVHVAVSEKSSTKSPKRAGSKKASQTRPTPADSLDTNEVMAAFRKASRGRGAMSREELMREVSQVLGYQRLGSAIGERLRGHLRAAIRRGIVAANSEWVQPATRTIGDYDRERLIEAMRSVMRAGKEYPRDEVVQATAEYLGFSRVTANLDTVMRTAIRTAIRQGDVVSDRDVIWRI
ncbi:MAG: restriction endonuclease subunit S [Thermodesulfobacteriota bacterium]|nr:restriction endonuclease subunit S [Thermodesulfobacteriota bacterium]